MSTVFCSYHPERRAQGVCMACRKVVCSECSTKIDGINHCITCLQQKAARPKSREVPLMQGLGATASVGGLCVLLYWSILFHGWWQN